MGEDIHCVANNAAVLEGLLCVFHVERSSGNGLSNTQNELPLLSDWDKQCIAVRERWDARLGAPLLSSEAARRQLCSCAPLPCWLVLCTHALVLGSPAVQALGAEFEIDFINLSYTRTAEDVREARRCALGWAPRHATPHPAPHEGSGDKGGRVRWCARCLPGGACVCVCVCAVACPGSCTRWA